MKKCKIINFIVVITMAAAMAYGCSSSGQSSPQENELLLTKGEACVSNEECSSGLCQAGVCAEPEQGEGGLSEDCLTDTDCAEGLVCSDSLCSGDATDNEDNPLPGGTLSGVPDEANAAKEEFTAFMDTSVSSCFDEMDQGVANCDCLSIVAEEEGNANLTLDNCVTVNGLSFDGAITMEEPSTITGTMDTFGECTSVQLNIIGECVGTLSGSCLGEEFDCTLNGAEGDACDCVVN